MLDKVKSEYTPSDKEKFMSKKQKDYFRGKLSDWKAEIIRESKGTLDTLHDQSEKMPDASDRASSETDRSIELRARDRQRKLISKLIQRSEGLIRVNTDIVKLPANQSALNG